MSSYALWNNKGGVGKSFLTFTLACEYANLNQDCDVYVIDLCPQGNVSEMLVGPQIAENIVEELIGSSPRKTIGGYMEARLNSPFIMNVKAFDYVISPHNHNKKIPQNVKLIFGDYLLEILSEAMRQASQLSVPLDAWGKVISWVRDLVSVLSKDSENNDRDSIFLIDCNPSFAIYTQMALVAADSLIVPFTADDSSRRAIENILALVYGIGNPKIASYARLSFSEKAASNNVSYPKIHTFINNRVTYFDGRPSKAFEIANKRVKETVDNLFVKHKKYFYTRTQPSEEFVEIPDYHGASIVSALTGTPIHKLTAGPKTIAEGHERVQLNKEPLQKYKNAMSKLAARL